MLKTSYVKYRSIKFDKHYHFIIYSYTIIYANVKQNDDKVVKVKNLWKNSNEFHSPNSHSLNPHSSSARALTNYQSSIFIFEFLK